MRQRALVRRSVTLLAVALLISAVPAAADESRAVIYDSAARKLVVIATADGAQVASISMTGRPNKVLVAPGKDRLVVLGRGNGSEGADGTFRPKGKSYAIVIDLIAGKAEAPLILGWGLGDALLDEGGRLYVFTPGYMAKKPADTLAAELIAIDVATARETARISLDRPGAAFGFTGAASAAIFIPNDPRRKLDGELRLLRLPSMEQAGSVALTGQPAVPVMFAGDDHAYVLDPPSSQVRVISLDQMSVVATLAVGEKASIGAVDRERKRLFVLSAKRAGKSEGEGRVDVIAGREITAMIVLPFEPRIIRPASGSDHAFVAGEKFKSYFGFREVDVVRLDLASSSAGTVVETKSIDGHTLLTTADGSRMIVQHGSQRVCCTLSISDVAEGNRVAMFETGSRGERIATALASAALTLLSYQSEKSAARSSGDSSFYYTIYTPSAKPPTRGSLLLRGDDRFAYVLDPVTDDLTIADVESGEKVANHDAGSGVRELAMLGDGRALAVVSASSVAIYDTATNEKLGEVPGPVSDFEVSERGDRALLLSKKGVVILDGDGKAIATLSGFKDPTFAMFLDWRESPGR